MNIPHSDRKTVSLSAIIMLKRKKKTLNKSTFTKQMPKKYGLRLFSKVDDVKNETKTVSL